MDSTFYKYSSHCFKSNKIIAISLSIDFKCNVSPSVFALAIITGKRMLSRTQATSVIIGCYWRNRSSIICRPRTRSKSPMAQKINRTIVANFELNGQAYWNVSKVTIKTMSLLCPYSSKCLIIIDYLEIKTLPMASFSNISCCVAENKSE